MAPHRHPSEDDLLLAPPPYSASLDFVPQVAPPLAVNSSHSVDFIGIMSPTPIKPDEKASDTTFHIEEAKTPPELAVEGGRHVDRFGAGAEKSPEERALIRKLDLRIVPMLFLMYLFNYYGESSSYSQPPLSPRLIIRPLRYCPSTIEWPRRGPWLGWLPVQRVHFDSLCRIHRRAGAVQHAHVDQEDSPILVDVFVDDGLGYHVGLHGPCHRLHGHVSHPVDLG